MADDRGRGLPPPRDMARDDGTYLPPVRVDDDNRTRTYQPRMPVTVSLPPIQDNGNGPPPTAYSQPPHARYPPNLPPTDSRDPRASANYTSSPSNGYNPLPPQQHAPGYHLPPPPGAPGPPVPPGAPYDPYRQNPQYPPQPGYEYNRPPPPYADPRYAQELGRGGMPNQHQMQPGAPRQRTSIACKYCRRRKIRCSGYQNAPGGKCSNCVKMNQECVFQPVSSSASTAFVPISAVQGHLAPGTQLYGAYGQPLPAGGGPPPPQSSQQQHYPPHGPPPGAGDYPPHGMQSPTTPYPQGPFESDRRRPREEDHHAPRLPPPHPYQESDPRRRSPAASATTHSPGTYSSYPPPASVYEAGGVTPTQRASPGSGTPNQTSSSGGVMSLGNIMDGLPRSDSSMDQNMLSRLNRPAR